mmetsp:Transcript_4862/g.9631  ORF Transcript_4862/g.9631 Transcript_4862/m.9631 type:complete len:96 (+) Transcript_4862:1598-1885(+)
MGTDSVDGIDDAHEETVGYFDERFHEDERGERVEAEETRDDDGIYDFKNGTKYHAARHRHSELEKFLRLGIVLRQKENVIDSFRQIPSTEDGPLA